MPRSKRVGNPLAAAIVAVIIMGMGAYLLLEGGDPTPRFFGGVLIVMGAAGAVGNLALRWHYRREDRRGADHR